MEPTQRRRSRKGHERIEGGFVALPLSVMNSRAYCALSVAARALLVELVRQYTGSNNGRLICTEKVMAPRGWRCSGTLTKNRRELIAAGFLHETFKGQRPNKASWFALTWRALNEPPAGAAYDRGAREGFERGAFLRVTVPADFGRAKLRGAAAKRNATSPGDVLKASIASPGDVVKASTTSPGDAIRPLSAPLSTSLGEDHIAMPSGAGFSGPSASSGSSGLRIRRPGSAGNPKAPRLKTAGGPERSGRV
jgi:hypothetical protein